MHTTVAGEAACLTAALLWAVSLAVFRASIATHGARTINLAKCLLAAVLQGATVVALGQTGSLTGASPRDLGILAFSGLIGLTLGDTALFAAVTRIGLHRTLLLQTLSPVFAALLAAVWQGERPTTLQALGAAIVLVGVGVVVAPARARGGVRTPIPSPTAMQARSGSWAAAGVLLAVLAAFGQGSGLVLAKVGMVEIPVVAASFLRLAAAAIGLGVVAAAAGRFGSLVRVARRRFDLVRVIPATFFGTYLALFAMMAGIALAPASVAAVLLSTSPLFSLVIERVVDGRPMTARGLSGTLLAVAGVAVLVNG